MSALPPPWTDDQVDNINAHQRAGFFHPLTCGCDPADGSRTLVARTDGLHCPNDRCGWFQTSCVYEDMADGSLLAECHRWSQSFDEGGAL